MERGTMAATREDACGVEGWMFTGLTVRDSLGILLSVFPGGYKRAVDCDLAAHNCQEVEACEAFYFADHDQYVDELKQMPEMPECDSERTGRCEGNVVKYCESADDKTFHQASYDCTLAGATCVEYQVESGGTGADCQAPRLQCQGPAMPYCDGSTRAVICEETEPGILSPSVFDCADAFASHCIVRGENAACEGPAVGEKDCDDGKDGDGDGKVDCMDRDCSCVEQQCDDGIDGDGDGKVDCDDGDCSHTPSCP
jgi:hypothetical protein